MSETVIGRRPPNDGAEWDVQCARCGSSMGEREPCGECDGDGYVSRHEEDPLWYDEDDLYPCSMCQGSGGWRVCLSVYGHEEPTWCEANPMPGREKVACSTPEWFRVAEEINRG